MNPHRRPLTVDDLRALRAGRATLAEIRGLSDEALAAGVRLGEKLAARGELDAAAELLAGMALYDPYRPDVWQALAGLCRCGRDPGQAALYDSLARAMAA